MGLAIEELESWKSNKVSMKKNLIIKKNIRKVKDRCHLANIKKGATRCICN